MHRVVPLTLMLLVVAIEPGFRPSSKALVPLQASNLAASSAGATNPEPPLNPQFGSPAPMRGSEALEMLPLVVDGAANPEAIPDDLAFRHFLKAVAEGAVPSPHDLQRREALVARIGFSTDHVTEFVNVVRGLRDELESIEIERVRWVRDTPSAWSEIGLLREREVATLENAKSRLLQALGSDGSTILTDHIRNHVKRQIKIYSDIPAAH